MALRNHNTKTQNSTTMKRLLTYSISILAAVAFAAIAPCKAQDNSAKKTILTIGDSNGSFKWSWPVQLQNLLPEMEVINNSESGRTVGQTNLGRESLNGCLIIDGIMEQVDQQLAGRNLDYIVICFGTNDGKVDFKDKTAEFKQNLETFMDKIENSAAYKRSKPQVILVTPFPMDETHEKFIPAKYEGATARIEGFGKDMETVAAERRYTFINVFKPMTNDMIEHGTIDGVHLMPELSAYVAGRIGAAISEEHAAQRTASSGGIRK